MIGVGLLLAMAAADAGARSPSASSDAAIVADALDGRRLQLEMRAQRVSVDAMAEPAEEGCATRIVARAPWGSRPWSRLFRWGDLAWAGMTVEGLTQAAFYDFEGHLATDLVAFAPPDPAQFRDALDRLVQYCRDRAGPATRILSNEGNRSRTCFLAARPEIQIIASKPEVEPPTPPRIAISLYSRESPQVELQLFFEGVGERAWSAPVVGFMIAEPRLVDGKMDKVAFAIDGQGHMVRHSIAAFSRTRLRIAMDQSDPGFSRFTSALASGEELVLTLWSPTGSPADTYRFNPRAAIAEARDLLSDEELSCDAAVAPPPRAADWHAVH